MQSVVPLMGQDSKLGEGRRGSGAGRSKQEGAEAGRKEMLGLRSILLQSPCPCHTYTHTHTHTHSPCWKVTFAINLILGHFVNQCHLHLITSVIKGIMQI